MKAQEGKTTIVSRNKSTSGSLLAGTKHDGRQVGGRGDKTYVQLCTIIRACVWPTSVSGRGSECQMWPSSIIDEGGKHEASAFFFFVELHPDDFLHLWCRASSLTARWFIGASSLMSTVCFTALRRTRFHRLALIIAPQLFTHRSPHKSYFVFIYSVMITALPQRLIWSISSCLHCVLTL